MGREILTEKLVPDNTDTVPADETRVNIHDESEVEYWCREFGVTPAQLVSAVEKVGDLARPVETELKRR